MGFEAAVLYLTTMEDLTAAEAEILLACAQESKTGMAMHGRRGLRPVWATHMTTLNGKFIIELG